MNKTQTPLIRFKGFTDPWEQRKLGEVVGVYDGVHQTPQYTESGVMFLSVENIATLTSQKYISEEAFERDYKVYPQKGDVLMTRIGDVGTPNVVETSEKLAFYVSLALLKPTNIDSYFLCNAIQSPQFKKGLKDRTLVTAIPQKINKDEIGKVDILMPSLRSEQIQIGVYFRQLEDLITLHQRKYEMLVNIKKSLLNKMFPKNGNKYPEIRFDGFTDPWEQRKLGDIGSVAMCRRIFKHQTSESGEIPFFKIGTFGGEPDAFISRELFEEFKAKYPYPDKGDILISASGSIGRTVKFAGKNEYFQDSNIVWLKHDKSIINPFLRHLYLVVEWAGIEGSTIKRLYNDNIMKTEVMLPSVQEQTKIAEMLDGVDNLITLHQRKLEKMKNMKRSLLAKMFAN